MQHEINVSDFDWLLEFAKQNEIGLVVSGSEGPIVNGLEAHFYGSDIPFFAPSRDAARLEGSKCFAKAFMKRHGIPTAAFSTFDNYDAARQHLQGLEPAIVVKASGLAAGKGVLMPSNMEEAVQALHDIMIDRRFGDAGNEVVIEERLIGDEISITLISNGKTLKMFPAGQDAQRILDGNVGANTGGMGVYAPTPLLTAAQLCEIESSILQRTIDGCQLDSFLCVGIIMSIDGPKLLEYNARFGDPESQALLPLLDGATDLAELMLAATSETPDQCHMGVRTGYGISIVAATEGHPFQYRRNDEMTNARPDIVIFHAGTMVEVGKVLTHGGRVVASTSKAFTLREAVERAYFGLTCVHSDGMYFRRDIAQKAIQVADDAVLKEA